MSDSDDTDVLLLIPPDLYTIRSPQCLSPANYFHNHPADTNYASSKTVENILPRAMEQSLVNSTPFVSRHYLSEFTGSRNNEFSPIPSSDPSLEILNGELNSASISRPKRNDNLLRNHSIDKFSSTNRSDHPKNETYKIEKNRNIEVVEQSVDGLNLKNDNTHQSPKFTLKQVDKLLNEMEKTREEIKIKLQSNKNKIHEMRREYSSKNSNSDENMNYSKQDQLEVTNSLVSSTIDCLKNNSKKLQKKEMNLVLPDEPKNVLHLSKILSKDMDFGTLHQKLEAEILKRKHCEEVIQQLQSNILEQQENLNVALKVDRQKDELIEQFRRSWKHLIEHWKELEHQRQELAVMLEQERTKAENNHNNLTRKIEYLEIRFHDAVSLANNHREKCELLEKSLMEVQKTANNDKYSLHDRMKTNEQNIKLLEIEKKEMIQKIEKLGKSLTDEKERVLKNEADLSDCNVKLSRLIREKDELTAKYEKEIKLVNQLKTDLVTMKLNFERAHSAENAATHELNAVKNELSKIKSSLKEFYQRQLDFALNEKVNEFQKEIDKMQALMRIEMQKQSKFAEKKFAIEFDRLKKSHEMELSEERRIYEKQINVLKSELKENRKKLFELDIHAEEKFLELIQNFSKNKQPGSDLVSDFENSVKNTFVNACDEDSENNRQQTDEGRNSQNSEFPREIVSESELGKYIEMLLAREPNYPINNTNLEAFFYNGNEDLTGKSINDQIQTNKSRRKPPWK